MVHYKLSYFDLRGVGEPIRLIFHYAKVPFEDERITFEDWPNHKERFPHGQVPVLEIDGSQFMESNAIMRYLGKKHGLAGKDEFEELWIDGIGDYHKDAYAACAPYLYAKLEIRPGDPDVLHQSFLDGAAQHFPNYVKYLKESGSGFLSKGGLTWVDFLVANYFYSIREVEPEVLAKYPSLIEYVDRVHSIPQIHDYVSKRPYHNF